MLKDGFTTEEIDISITKTMEEAFRDASYKDSDSERLAEIKKDTIIIHGIHQFTPIMLKTIEILGAHKNVFILFNYIPDYKMYTRHG